MELAIIGGGPAGLSAAIRAKELGIKDVWVIERAKKLGGILNQCIHHGFGVHVFKEELTGPEYAQRLIDRASELEVNFVLGAMVTDITPDRRFTYASERGLVTVCPQAVILAMGCRERSRGAVGIPGDRVAGVFSAGAAQALVNMKGFALGKQVVILGSGDIGLIMARRMTLEGASVLGVYEIMPHSSGLKRNIAQCLNDYNIPLHLSQTVTRIRGKRRLEGVYVASVDKNLNPDYETETFVPCDTLLLSVGLIPENELSLKMGVELSPITGGAIVNNRLETNIPGVFAAGNVLHVHDIVDYVTEEAYIGAENAVRFMRGDVSGGNKIKVRAGEGVRYTVPMEVVWQGSEVTELISFRVNKVFSKAEIAITAGGKTIHSAKKRILLPSEMERVEIRLSEPVHEVTVEVR